MPASPIKSTSEYKDLSPDDIFRSLGTTVAGLSESAAAGVRERYGANEITEKSKSILLVFLKRYWGPMPWLLELAIALSLFLGHTTEAIIISVLLSINAVIGVLHSRNSQKALELLKQKLAVGAKVLRDGAWKLALARDLVPGDIITVRLGDVIPADAVVIGGELMVDDSTMTGESLPVEAEAGAVIYSGSTIQHGEATCVVVNTGGNTYFGKTAQLVNLAKSKSYQEEVMLAIVKYMMYVGIIALVIVLAYGLIVGVASNVVVILTLAVTFLMGAVPVALPAVLTIVQAVGAMELAKHGALVTRLDSIEDAASIDILCIDKTGTITSNSLSVTECAPVGTYTEADVARVGTMASREQGMDSIDLAVLAYASRAGADTAGVIQHSFTPFSPATKRTEAIVEQGGKQFRVIKGAAQIVLPLCSATDAATIAAAEGMVDANSRKGYRVLAVAISDAGVFGELHLVGFLSLTDPPRPEARATIETARSLGIKPMMLTGDNIAIAREIAAQVGIGGNIIRLKDIDSLPEAEQKRTVAGCDGFAEIYPEDKFRIITLLQSMGHIVGMTGDGVNDAPALKQAVMGIAVSTAADVAKASASVVLTTPGIQVLVEAVKTSRETFQRMLTWVINKIVKVIEFVALLTIGFFWFHDIVISLLGTSLLVFANDFITMSISTDNVVHTSDPNVWNVKHITFASLVIGLLFVVQDVIVILLGTYVFRLNWPQLQALVMLNLVFNSQFRIMLVREREHVWSSRPGKSLLGFSMATVVVFVLMASFGVIIPHIPVHYVLAVVGFGALYAILADFPKLWAFRKFGL